MKLLLRILLDAMYLVGLVLYSPVLLYRIFVVGKDRHGWSERFGSVPRRESGRPAVWIHAVSLGEANATVKLVEQLRAALPEFDLAISTTTDTGSARVAQLHPQAIRFRFPLDFSPVVRRVFNRIRPTVIVLMELEVWPNLTAQAARRNVPVIVVNGRLSPRSFARYRRFLPLVRPMFRRLAAVCAQSDLYADRFAALGVPAGRVSVTGSVKYDTATVANRVAGQDELAAAMGLRGEHVMLLGGSTGPGEEEILLRVFRGLSAKHPAVRLAIVPRKPERFAEVAGLIERAGFRCWRRSQHGDGQSAADWPADIVVLGDTMGELRKFYALAQVAFVGRSLAPMGGSDVMEAAALGRAVLVGPHTENFAEPVERLVSAGGLVVVRDEAHLVGEVDRLLADASARAAMGRSARAAVQAAQGATARTVAVIQKMFGTI